MDFESLMILNRVRNLPEIPTRNEEYACGICNYYLVAV